MKLLLSLLLIFGIMIVSKAEDAELKAREIDKLLHHLGYDDSLPRMLGSLKRTFQKTYSALNIPNEVWDEVAKELSYKEIRAMCMKLYSEKLTLEEVQAANAFYESEVGNRYAKKVAEIGEQEFIEAREWSRKKVEGVLKRYSKSKGLLKEPSQTAVP